MTEGRASDGPELAIVLPVYNEGEAVEPVLRALAAGVTTRHELVIVYDFDEDTTVPVVELSPWMPSPNVWLMLRLSDGSTASRSFAHHRMPREPPKDENPPRAPSGLIDPPPGAT